MILKRYLCRCCGDEVATRRYYDSDGQRASPDEAEECACDSGGCRNENDGCEAVWSADDYEDRMEAAAEDKWDADREERWIEDNYNG